MVLTKEQRIELLSRAREAKAKKRLVEAEAEPEVVVEPPVEQPPTPKVKSNRKKQEVVPLPVPVPVVIEEPEVEEPLPVPKKKGLPAKWLKNPKTEPEKVCCDVKLTKEEPLMVDEKPQVVADKIVIPSKKELKKPRVPRASSRTLEIVAEPTPIEEVLEEVKNNNTKYLPKVRQAQPQSAPISIIRTDAPLRLFDY
jgi:hypothetical protein